MSSAMVNEFLNSPAYLNPQFSERVNYKVCSSGQCVPTEITAGDGSFLP